MSVCLTTLTDPEEIPVELWAPDFSCANVWLVYEYGEENDSRIDLSIDQLRQLRDAIDGILP